MLTVIKRLLILSALLLSAAAFAADGGDGGIALEANRDQLYLGESFILRVTISGAGQEIQPDLSRIRNCRVELLGGRNINSSSISIKNGRVTREVFKGCVQSYRITPFDAGLFQAGPVSVTIKGKTFAGQGPVVSVRDIAKQDMVRLSITSSRETVLVDEPFEVTLEILIRALDGKYSTVQPLFPDNPPNVDARWLSGAPVPGLDSRDINEILNEHLAPRRDQAGIGINSKSLRFDPFDFESLSGLRGFFNEPRRAKYILNPRIVEEDENSYVRYSLSIVFTPREEGDFVFGPAVFKGVVPAEVNEAGQARGAEIFAVGHACTVRVVPPPEEGRPRSFSGALGSNLVASASLDAAACNVGDPVRLTLSLSGDVRLNNMLPPKLTLQTNLQERFMIYDSTVESVKDGPSVRRFIYTLRPTKPGACEFPPVEVSYYDTGERVYRTVRTDPIPVEIGKTQELTGAGIIGRPEQSAIEEEKPDPAAAVPASFSASPSGARAASLLGNTRLIGVVAGAGPLLYALALLGGFVRDNRESWRKGARRRRAMPGVVAGLRAARTMCGSDPDAARAAVCDAVRRYLSERLHLPSAACTPDDIRTRLLDAGVEEGLARRFSSAFGKVFDAGFSKSGGQNELESAIAELSDMIPLVEKDIARSIGGGYCQNFYGKA